MLFFSVQKTSFKARYQYTCGKRLDLLGRLLPSKPNPSPQPTYSLVLDRYNQVLTV